ncbi:MAG: phosphoglucosamine mutase [Steroidobacteraceae bacterium]
MSRKYFGTDGVRGRVGEPPLTVDFVLRLASAAARVLAPEGGSVLIGKDTRLSGYMFEAALEAGFVAAGVDAMLIGPLPTPGVAYMTRHFGCKFGVVISASHNPYHDNGIKFFDGAGGKLSDEEEARIEAELENLPITRESKALGRATRVDKTRKAYQEFCISTMAPGTSLAGMKIVIDCAHGAGYKVGPRILADLGAEIVPLGCSPNGRNINQGCGSLAPELLQLTVPGVRAQVGIALDGDGDRLVMVDHLGRKVDGDQLLYVIATHRHATGRLSGPVVGTLMTNYGLERALGERGIEFHRAQVGDRYVLAKLRETGGVLGGETSGHLLTLDYTTTGDAMVVALQVLSIMRETGKTLAELTAELTLLPQTMVNVKVSQRFDPLGVAAVRDAMTSVEQRLAGRGRVVLRASGTEPLIRVMIEAEDGAEAKSLANELAGVVRAAAPAA